MAIELENTRNDRVVVARFHRKVTAEDINLLASHMESLLSKSSVPIHNISDVSLATAFPANTFSVVQSVRKTFYHPMMGSTVVVTRKPFHRVMLNGIAKVFPAFSPRIVKTVQDAQVEIDRLLGIEMRV